MPNNEISWECAQFAISRYVFASGFVKNKIVLDIACGGGYGSHYLVKRDARMVIGGDISGEAVEYARTHYQEQGLHFLRLDAQRLPFKDNCLDIVVSYETIEHLAKYEDFLRECLRILKDSGILVLSTPNKGAANPDSKKLACSFHIREFSVKELEELLYRYFLEVSLYGHSYWKKVEKIESRLLYGLRAKFSSIQVVEKTGLFLAALILPKYRRTRISQVKDFDLVGTRCIFSLQNSSPSPRHVIAICRKKRGADGEQTY